MNAVSVPPRLQSVPLRPAPVQGALLRPAQLRSVQPGRPPRFDKARATLALLLLSAAVFAFSALEQVRALPGELGPHASVWDDRSPEQFQNSPERQR